MVCFNMEELLGNAAFKQIALRYPHIGIKLKAYWATKAFDPYMHDLFTHTRNGERRGFPPEDLARLRELKELHDSLHKDVWIYTI